MADPLSPALPRDGRLTENIVWFARALRRAGLPIGPGRIADAVRAVEAAGFSSRDDFYWTLHASFVSRPEERAVFAQIFRLFWRDPRYLEKMMAMLSPLVRGTQAEVRAKPAERRAAEALLDGADRPVAEDAPAEDALLEIDAARTASSEERLRTLDFEQMGPDEMRAARHMLARLTLPVPPLPSRRTEAGRGARIDWRRTFRTALRQGGEIARPLTRHPRTRRPNLVVLCDISGSMSQYSRAVLHFVHAVANAEGQGWGRVHAFTFGTRLTNISRHMAARDVDAALAAAGAEAQDWSGGTRIGTSLRVFNRDWSRRVTGQGAVILLVTDGLDRDPDGDTGGGLAREMERLRLSARAVIWLNPLLRWDGFAPRARGVRAILPHVTHLRAGHTIASLEGLAAALADPAGGGDLARVQAAARDGPTNR